MKSQIIFIAVIALISYSVPALSQSSGFMPQKVELSDTVLRNSISKYESSLSDREIMIVARESRLDSVRYYISAINSLYKVYKNIPSAYIQIGTKYVFLYTGLEQVAMTRDDEKSRFTSQFKNILINDLSADGKTRDPHSLSTYDPIKVVVTIKGGKVVHEDYKKGFSPYGGMPYITNK